MNINIKLSDQSIQNAINRLKKVLEYFDEDSGKLVDILAQEGAEIAQSAYGSYPVKASHTVTGNRGVISVTGDMPAIAEFGAGDATVTPSGLFDTTGLDVDVWPGSYSLYEGTMDYYFLKHWKFGGRWYTEVRPHLGLAQAKMFWQQNSTQIAREVIQFD